MKKTSFVSVVAVLAVLALATLINLSALTAKAQQPVGGTIDRVVSFTLYPTTAIVTGTTYSDASRTTSGGMEVARWTGWNSADLFVNIDGTGTFTLVSTVQASPDGQTWADVSYEYWNGSAMTVGDFSRTQTADGTVVMRVPATGEWVRMKMVATGTVTPTVQVTYRNN